MPKKSHDMPNLTVNDDHIVIRGKFRILLIKSAKLFKPPQLLNTWYNTSTLQHLMNGCYQDVSQDCKSHAKKRPGSISTIKKQENTLYQRINKN